MATGDQDKISPSRRRRIQRLKRTIVAIILLLIIVPWVILGFMGIRYKALSSNLKKVSDEKARVEEELVEKTEKAAVLKELTELLQKDIAGYREKEEAESKEEEKPVPIITESENGIRDYKSPDGIKRIYITFDDGPSENTEEILDILDEYHVQATFFTVANTSDEGKELYRKIIARGHSLGIHSYTHKYAEIYKSEEDFFEDFNRLSDFIYDVTGYRSNIARLPGGSSNKVSDIDMSSLIERLHEQGIHVYDWNVSGKDADGDDPEAEEITASVLAGVEKFDTVVVLLHDGADKKNTVEALPLILDELTGREDVMLLPITEETPEILHIDVAK